MSFKGFYYLQFWRDFRPIEPNHLCNFGRGHYEEDFCEISLILDQWFGKCCLKYFLYRALEVLFSGQAETFVKFCRKHYEEHFCEISLNLEPMPIGVSNTGSQRRATPTCV